MKKITILAVILVLVMALTACGKEEAPETTAAPTVAATTVPAETAAPAQTLTLTDWAMSASTWSSPNGATIHFTATPSTSADGQTADYAGALRTLCGRGSDLCHRERYGKTCEAGYRPGYRYGSCRAYYWYACDGRGTFCGRARTL